MGSENVSTQNEDLEEVISWYFLLTTGNRLYLAENFGFLGVCFWSLTVKKKQFLLRTSSITEINKLNYSEAF